MIHIIKTIQFVKINQENLRWVIQKTCWNNVNSVFTQVLYTAIGSSGMLLLLIIVSRCCYSKEILSFRMKGFIFTICHKIPMKINSKFHFIKKFLKMNSTRVWKNLHVNWVQDGFYYFASFIYFELTLQSFRRGSNWRINALSRH